MASVGALKMCGYMSLRPITFISGMALVKAVKWLLKFKQIGETVINNK